MSVRSTLVVLLALAPASLAAGELVVDDFEDGDTVSRLGLAWMVLADDLIGGASDGRFEPVSEGDLHAARLEGERRVVDGVPVSFVGAWTAVGEDGGPRDLSEYEGVRIRARATAGTFTVGLRRAGASQNYAAPIELGAEWREVDVPFDALRALGPPGAEAPSWSSGDATWVGLSSGGPDGSAVRAEIDRIAFYGGPDATQARESQAPSGWVTATMQLVEASSLTSLRWNSLVEDPAGDGLRRSLPDAVALAWANGPEDRLWFRVSLAARPPEGWMGINISLDTDEDPGSGTAWWGSNSEFHFDQLLTAYLTRTDAYWMGAAGLAGDDDVARGVMNGLSDDVVAAVDREEPAFLVGVARAALPASGTVRLVATVGSSLINNDDVPNDGAVTLELQPAER